MPSATPSLTPTVDPTIEPTYDPTTVPSLVPSADPTADPTSDPTTTDPIVPLTNSPQGLREVLMENEGAPQLQLFTNYILYGILSAVFLAGIVTTAFTIRFSGLEDLINVDDQRLNGSLRYTVQIVDVFTDIAFALQCRAFWLYLRDENVDANPEVFGWLYRLSLICVVAPYAMNLLSAINIARKIAGSDSLSEHSKQFFLGQNKVFFAILVLLSGGAFPSLQLTNSNIFGLPVFSAGLSRIQFASFRSHHFLSTVLFENAPQMALQYVFIFELGLDTGTAVVSFMATICNILFAVIPAAAFWKCHRNQREFPFAISLSWTKNARVLPVVNGRDLDPFAQCGRRQKLAKLLGQILTKDDQPLNFEILSSAKQGSSCSLCGVLVSDQEDAARTECDGFDLVLNNERGVALSLSLAFRLRDVFERYFAFDVAVSESPRTSPQQRRHLTLAALRYFKVPEDVVSLVREHMDQALARKEAADVVVGEGGAGANGRTTGQHIVERRSVDEVELAVVITKRPKKVDWRENARPLMSQLIEQGLTVSMMDNLHTELLEEAETARCQKMVDELDDEMPSLSHSDLYDD